MNQQTQNTNERNEEPDAIELLEADEQGIALDILTELNQAPGDNTFRIRVSRVTGPNILASKEPFLFEIDGTNINGLQDRLSKEYGNGTYRVRIIRNNRIYRRFDITIELPRVSPAIAPIEPRVANEMNSIAQLLNDMNQRQMVFMEQIMTRMQQPPQQTQQDPISMMEKMSTIFANMRGNDSGATALLGAFTSGMEIVGKMNGEKGETGLMDIAKELINSPVLSKIMEQKPSAPQTHSGFNPGPRIQPQSPAMTVPMPNPQPTSMLGTPEEKQPGYYPTQNPNVAQSELDNLIPLLIQKAQRNSDPGLIAEFVLDSLSPQEMDLILADTQFLDRLITVYPAVGNHRAWFEETLAEMKQQAQTEREAVANTLATHATTQGPAFGNARNTGRGGRDAGNTQTDASNSTGVQEKPVHP